MQCAELERYLESYLDGRLGRNRAWLMRRHLAGCPTCRIKVQKLKDFELELNNRLRMSATVESLWQGLEVELVRSARTAMPVIEATSPPRLLPAPAPPAENATTVVRRVRASPQPEARPPRGVVTSRLVGVVLIAAAIGGAVQSGRGLIAMMPGEVAVAERPEGDRAVEFGTSDPANLEAWLVRETGVGYPVPGAPPGFRLLGGRLAELDGVPAALILYGAEGGTASLFVSARPLLGAVEPAAAPELNRIAWERDGFGFTLLSTLPADELVSFTAAY
jgi:anti-sigma factor RsiW